MAEITVAKNAGFCFGVARATAAVEREMAEHIPGERIFTLGRLIHNEDYNRRLHAGGVTVISTEDVERLASEATPEAKDLSCASPYAPATFSQPTPCQGYSNTA